MSNHGLIRLERLISSFIVELCNYLFFSTVFNASCMCPKIRCDGYCAIFLETKHGLSRYTKHSVTNKNNNKATIRSSFQNNSKIE